MTNSSVKKLFTKNNKGQHESILNENVYGWKIVKIDKVIHFSLEFFKI